MSEEGSFVGCRIELSLNVNHTVDSDGGAEAEPQNQAGDAAGAEMRSRPNFEVDIRKGNQTLSFSCSYVQEGPAESQEDYSTSS